MVSLCALFFGPWAAAMAVVMTAACRLWLGGAGAVTGLLVILSSAGIGLLAHFRLKPTVYPPSAQRLYLFGLVVHLTMLAFMFTLPGNVAAHVIMRIGPPVMLLYPLATILAGKILSDQVSAVHAMADLQQTKQNLTITLQSIGDGVISTNLKGEIVFMNPVAEALTGWSQTEARGKPFAEIFRIVNEETRKKAEDPLGKVLRSGKVVGLANHTLLIAKDGIERPIADSAAPISDAQGEITGVVLVFRDQSEQRLVQRLMKVRLTLQEYATTHTLDAFLTKALDETSAIVDSPIGFYHFVEADQNTLSLQHWSTRTLKEYCRAKGGGMYSSIDRAGIWGECVRRQKPVVHNGYASLPHKKGLPEGHVEVVRELVVPVMREGKVVAILGVGNKSADYTEKDVEIVSYLADMSWHIVERKLAEEALRESEALFRNLFEHHAAVKLIIDPDTGNIIDANQSAEEYYGWPREQLRQMKIQDINVLSPIEVKQEMEKARDQKRVYFEFSHRRSDGSIRDVEVYSSKIEVKGKELLHSIVHDVTERKRVERMLQEREAKYRDLFENAPIGIFSTTSRGQALSVNTAMARILGYRSPQEAIERYPDLRSQLYVNPGWRDRFLQLLQEKDYVENFEYEARRADGKTVWLSMNARIAKRNGDGSFIINGFATDITVQRRLEDQFHHAQKMESVGRLAGGVAHDYNNMLSVILGYAELALALLKPSEPLYNYIQEILKAAERSTKVTRQLLAFARKQTISPKVIDLNETVEGMLKMLRRLIGEDIDLAWLPKTDLWPVKMDPSQIDQLLVNLCVNARDAIADVGKITIETQMVTLDKAYYDDHMEFAPGDFVVLAVSDNGCGMNKEIQDKLFEPFFTTKAERQGTGLGLATVHGIVKQNKGFVNVYSEPGKGTTFKIYLPRHVDNVVDPQEESLAEIAMGHGETILIVEDEVAILNLSRAMLERLGYTLLTASTVNEAMRLAEEHSGEIHLLITDVIMPEMNGRDLADQMHTLYPDIKILFMSGYTANVIAHHGVLDEEVRFIQKPFSIEELAAKVREALEPLPPH
jgi:PAS domain S-box-containing protein